jgi:site-specific recombinase XerD
MQEKGCIQHLVANAVRYLSEKSYSAPTIYHYKWVWKKFITFAEERGEKYYSTLLNQDFMDSFAKKSERTDSKYDKITVNKLRAQKVLDDYYHGKPAKCKYSSIPVYIPECFQEEFTSYTEYMAAMGQRAKTIETKSSRILVFLRYMEDNDITLSRLDFQALSGFMDYLCKQYTITGQSNIKFTLRDFLKFSEGNGYIPSGTALMMGKIYGNKHGRLPSTYTNDEINRILHSVDRSTVSGKRDYAMLILMAALGIRCSDICNLSLDAVRPESHSLVFRQQKTVRYESLPLTESIELALADYLKNARPESESDRLFVKCEGVHKNMPCSTSGLYNILNRYMKKAGIETEGKRHGPHSIRHSLSSNLIREGTPIPVIAGILGHSSSEITARYLWMDTEQLRQLALEVPYEK